MSAPDLHPEELLDGAAAGTISESERSRLDAHLDACPACRFELAARADFAALPFPSMPVDELVTRALSGMPSASVSEAVPRRKWPVGMIAAAVMLVGAASFGAIGLARPIAVLLGLVSTQPDPAVPVPRQPSPPVEKVAPAVEVVVEAPAPEPATPVQEVPAPRDVIHRPLRPPSAPPSPPAPAITAAELFKTATAARSEGRFVDAEETYRALTRQFPGSAEASVAHAVMGRLLLDLNRPSEALEALDAALTGGVASLREDTLANRALALEAISRNDDALRAWQLLLSEFPRSPHATRARGRVEALSGP